RFLRITTAVFGMLLVASLAQAQLVSMTGEYHESSGRIVKIPQNPPLAVCGAGGNINAIPANDARCHGARQTIPAYGGAGPFYYAKPAAGVQNVGNTLQPGGLAVGDTFTLRPLALGQTAQNLSGQVVGNAVVQIDTSFIVALPGTARPINPQANTRVMAMQGAVPLLGQTGRLTGPTQTVSDVEGASSVDVVYKEGPNKFGGTMTALISGSAKLYIKHAGFDAVFPTYLQPVLGTQPVGDPANSLLTNERNGAGWDYTIMGGQAAGIVYGPATISTPCTTAFPTVSPAGCNIVTATAPGSTPGMVPYLLDVGNFLPAATSTKHVFPWTTGTVSVPRVAFKQGVTYTETLTARGYDTVSTGGARNVGLVAGSYSRRTSGSGTELSPQMIGIDLVFTPEPATTASLLAGVGLLGFLAARRRRS
ncbi:MAG: PEP-CTERM sorting domain-containing protein, partial [Myxococcota bacterium]